MFHYQQALANMQLQQPAFIPTGESLETLATPVGGPLNSYTLKPWIQEVACAHKHKGGEL